MAARPGITVLFVCMLVVWGVLDSVSAAKDGSKTATTTTMGMTTETTTDTYWTSTDDMHWTATDTISTDTVTTTAHTSGTTAQPAFDPARFVIKHDNNICMLANFEADIRISYQAFGEALNQTIAKTVPVELGEDADPFDSACAQTDEDVASLVLNWGQGTFRLQLDFTVQGEDDNSTEKYWIMSALYFRYNRNNTVYFPDAVTPETMDVNKLDLALFKTPLGQSYRCATGDEILVGEIEKGAAILFTNIQLQPFRVKDEKFSTANVCEVDETVEEMKKESWLVPVAVAGCLAFIIIILLTVYVISRSIKRTGYRNME